ncbi:hypothetical protein FRC07_008815 [Ceratobasidium sp. 392]|nr:hypothetical protein FRC07_008815 [Ceratobasidium sp. 392]
MWTSSSEKEDFNTKCQAQLLNGVVEHQADGVDYSSLDLNSLCEIALMFAKGIFVVGCVLEFYLCMIISRYVSQLGSESGYRRLDLEAGVDSDDTAEMKGPDAEVDRV